MPCVIQQQWGCLCFALFPSYYRSWLWVLPVPISGPLNSGVSVEGSISSFVIKLSNSSSCSLPSSSSGLSYTWGWGRCLLCGMINLGFFYMLFSASSQNRSKRKKGEELRKIGVNALKSMSANRILLKLKRGWVEVDKKKSKIFVL